MDIREQLAIDRISPSPRPAASSGAAAGFEVLLEQLDQPAAAASPTAALADFTAAVQDADQQFAVAMALRRDLEAAFRRHER